MSSVLESGKILFKKNLSRIGIFVRYLRGWIANPDMVSSRPSCIHAKFDHRLWEQAGGYIGRPRTTCNYQSIAWDNLTSWIRRAGLGSNAAKALLVVCLLDRGDGRIKSKFHTKTLTLFVKELTETCRITIDITWLKGSFHMMLWTHTCETNKVQVRAIALTSRPKS